MSSPLLGEVSANRRRSRQSQAPKGAFCADSHLTLSFFVVSRHIAMPSRTWRNPDRTTMMQRHYLLIIIIIIQHVYSRILQSGFQLVQGLCEPLNDPWPPWDCAPSESEAKIGRFDCCRKLRHRSMSRGSFHQAIHRSMERDPRRRLKLF